MRTIDVAADPPIVANVRVTRTQRFRGLQLFAGWKVLPVTQGVLGPGVGVQWARRSLGALINNGTLERVWWLDGLRRDLIFVDDQTGTTFKRQGWMQLQEQVLPGDTIVVVWQDRFSRNFEDGVAIQKDLTERGSGSFQSRKTSTPETAAPARSSSAGFFWRRAPIR